MTNKASMSLSTILITKIEMIKGLFGQVQQYKKKQCSSCSEETIAAEGIKIFILFKKIIPQFSTSHRICQFRLENAACSLQILQNAAIMQFPNGTMVLFHTTSPPPPPSPNTP